MWRMAKGASESGQGFYYISNTEAGKLISIDNKKFFDKIQSLCGGDQNLMDKLYGNPNPANGTRSAYVVGECLSINDHISNNLAKAAKGDVTIWVPNGQKHTVFSDTELRAVLKNENITSINGVPKEYFIEKYNSYAGGDVFDSLNTEKLDQNVLNMVFQDVKQMRTPEYFDNVVIHYDMKGKMISADATAICGGEFNKPENSVMVLKVGETRHFASETDMLKKYLDYDNYTSLEKLKAKQYDYERTQISQMLDDGVTNKNGITLLTKEEIRTKYGFVDDATPNSVIKEIQLAEYRDRKNGTATAKGFYKCMKEVICLRLVNLIQMLGLSLVILNVEVTKEKREGKRVSVKETKDKGG